jgi:hypothetical protein
VECNFRYFFRNVSFGYELGGTVVVFCACSPVRSVRKGWRVRKVGIWRYDVQDWDAASENLGFDVMTSKCGMLPNSTVFITCHKTLLLISVPVCAITASGMSSSNSSVRFGTFCFYKSFSTVRGWLAQRQGWRVKELPPYGVSARQIFCLGCLP